MTVLRRKRKKRLELQGAAWMTLGGEVLGGEQRMGLLRAIAEQGSITHAALAVGLSYKGAWNAIEAMHRLAGEPLVERSTGGRGGGGTRLTPYGTRLVERFEQIDAAHQRFMKLLDNESVDLDKNFSLLRILNMKTSARKYPCREAWAMPWAMRSPSSTRLGNPVSWSWLAWRSSCSW